MNLYTEITDILKTHRKTIIDILYVTGIDNKSTCFNPNDFLDAARNIDYNDGYGVEEINVNLRIVLKNGDFLKRSTYDGLEWFEYISIPKMDVEIKNLNSDIIIKY